MKRWINNLVLSLGLVLAVTGCQKADNNQPGADGQPQQTIVLGINGGDNTEEIIRNILPDLEQQGVRVKLQSFHDYVLPNVALASDEIDANLFQHVPYLERFLESRKQDPAYDLVAVGDILVAPIGFYSKTIKKLEDIPELGSVIVSNSVADRGRAIAMLQQAGLITLRPGVDIVAADFDDIVDNPRKLIFKADIEPALMPKVYENNEGDAIMINGTFVEVVGLNPLRDAVALESAKDNAYVNVVVVKEKNRHNPAVLKLVEALRSEKTKQFIIQRYHGTTLPAE